MHLTYLFHGFNYLLLLLKLTLLIDVVTILGTRRE